MISGKEWAERFYAWLIRMEATGRYRYMPWKQTGTPARKKTGYREARAGRMLKRFR